MGNTMFFENVKAEPKKITWKDIMSERKVKHDKAELEYAMTSGMAVNTATEANMLQKWHKPWIYRKVGIAGLSFIAFLYAIYFVLYFIGVSVDAITLLTIFFPPVIIPVSILIFTWELNIPKNLSIIDTLVAFLFGGIISIAISILINVLFMGELGQYAVYAPVAEEPGKFLAAIMILIFYAKKKKIKVYGITGVIIGAAVGAGFSAFETIQYVFNGQITEGVMGGLSMMLIRFIGSFGNHILFCAMYTGALALACEKNDKKIKFSSFFDGATWAFFFLACLLHALWNGVGFNSIILELPFLVGQVALHWFLFLKIVKKSLNQAVVAGNYQSGSGLSYQQEMAGMGVGSPSVPFVAAQAQPQPAPLQMQQAPRPVVQPQPAPVQMQQAPRPVMQPQPAPLQMQQAPRPVVQPQPVQPAPRPVVQPQPVQSAPRPVQQPQPGAISRQQAASASPVVRPQPVQQQQPQPVQPQMAQQKGTVILNQGVGGVRVECIGGVLRGGSFPVQAGGEVIIGRGEACKIKFPPKTPSVSRQHCKLICQGNSWAIVDLESTNGTFVNGQRLMPGVATPLNSGSTFAIAGNENIFRIIIQ